MAELKTKKNTKSVKKFLKGIDHQKRREDGFKLLDIIEEVTGESPSMWGDSIIGFGDHHYVYESGREVDWFKVGFSPRKQSLTVYLTYGFEEKGDLLDKLGKHRVGRACLYINKLEDIDIDILKKLIGDSYENFV